MSGHSVQERRCQAVSARQEQAVSDQVSYGQVQARTGVKGVWWLVSVFDGCGLVVDDWWFSVFGWRLEAPVSGWGLTVGGWQLAVGG